jgi:hypothetical protein
MRKRGWQNGSAACSVQCWQLAMSRSVRVKLPQVSALLYVLYHSLCRSVDKISHSQGHARGPSGAEPVAFAFWSVPDDVMSY